MEHVEENATAAGVELSGATLEGVEAIMGPFRTRLQAGA